MSLRGIGGTAPLGGGGELPPISNTTVQTPQQVVAESTLSVNGAVSGEIKGGSAVSKQPLDIQATLFGANESVPKQAAESIRHFLIPG